MSKVIAGTERLELREFSTSDAAFVLELLNQPAVLEFVGDKGVRSLDDAYRYIKSSPLASYRDNGFGHYVVTLREIEMPIGLCGLFHRAFLDTPDLGFAFLEQHEGNGYATEASLAVLSLARDVLRMPTVLAMTDRDNGRSAKVLGKLGFRFERDFLVPGEDAPLRLYAVEL